jgi:hypothetical protein
MENKALLIHHHRLSYTAFSFLMYLESSAFLMSCCTLGQVYCRLKEEKKLQEKLLEMYSWGKTWGWDPANPGKPQGAGPYPRSQTPV